MEYKGDTIASLERSIKRLEEESKEVREKLRINLQMIIILWKFCRIKYNLEGKDYENYGIIK